jgi:hypothetical protein
MDDHRFDAIARSFAISTRRQLLRRLAGAATSGLFGLAGIAATAAASCREPDRTCREHANCCSGICGPKNATGRRVCVCPPGQENCGGTCVTPDAYQNDAANCGACGHDCLDVPHVQQASCQDYACTVTACAPGFGDCDGDPANGCETPLGSDAHCADCGDTCAPSEDCLNGVCTQICKVAGATCHSSGECCSQVCDHTCTPLPCADVGEPCESSSDCCQHQCILGTCEACIPDGEPCPSFSSCCRGCYGGGGLCGGGFCLVTGGGCTHDDECCNFGEYCVGICL